MATTSFCDLAAVHRLAAVEVPDRAVAGAARTDADIGRGVHHTVPCRRETARSGAAEVLPVAGAAADRILPLAAQPAPAQVDRVVDVLAEVTV
jgi:hypothetical protein